MVTTDSAVVMVTMLFIGDERSTWTSNEAKNPRLPWSNNYNAVMVVVSTTC